MGPADHIFPIPMQTHGRASRSAPRATGEKNPLVDWEPGAALRSDAVKPNEKGQSGAKFDLEARRNGVGFQCLGAVIRAAAGNHLSRTIAHHGGSRRMPPAGQDRHHNAQRSRLASLCVSRRRRKERKSTKTTYSGRGWVGLEGAAAPTRDERRVQRVQPTQGHPRRRRSSRRPFSGAVGANATSISPNRPRAPFCARGALFEDGRRGVPGGRRAPRAHTGRPGAGPAGPSGRRPL